MRQPKEEAQSKKGACEAGTPVCSGEIVREYSVNGSAKSGVTFALCAPCKVYIGRTSKVVEAS